MATDLCALAAGIAVSIVFGLAQPYRPPIWERTAAFPPASHVAHYVHYLFHPLSRAVVAGLLVIPIVRAKGIGLFAAFCAFIAGGISAGIVLELLRNA